MSRSERQWRGFVAAILAIGAAASVLVLCWGAVTGNDPVSWRGAVLVAGALGALVGAAAAFVGKPPEGSRSDEEPEPVRPEPEPEIEP